MRKNHFISVSGWYTVLVFTVALAFLVLSATYASADEGVTLIIDGNRVDTSPAPVIRDGRTLVPVRLVSEKLGANVEWDEATRTVHIAGGQRSVLLRIDNRLVDYREESVSVDLCDVPPRIIDNRTFVPLRLVSNALGVAVRWEDASRTVYVDSGLPVERVPLSGLVIIGIGQGGIINGSTALQAGFITPPPASAKEIRFLLLDSQTGRGRVIARGSDLTAVYNWVPELSLRGERILAAGIYDNLGNFLGGYAIPVKVDFVPQVSLSGVAAGQTINGAVSLAASVNFVPEYLKYEITNGNTGKTFVSDEADPGGNYVWTPEMSDNGSAVIRVAAYDEAGQSYYSEPVSVTVDVPRELLLRGVAAGATIGRPVTLWPQRNFAVTQVEYLLLDPQSKREEVLAQTGYAGFTWFPGPEKAGSWQLAVRVKDTAGRSFTSEPVSIVVPSSPRLLLQTVGPNEVLTGEVKLKSLANVALSRIEYRLVNPKTGTYRVIAGGPAADGEYTWMPANSDSGSWNIQAAGIMNSGQTVLSEAIPIRVYLGKIYGPQPIIEKSRFLDFVSGLAIQSQAKTGMSAALQAAQAILETGWGQSTPVDKYTGKLSNNLFGIKGKGPAGSVISNTWEEYNGTTFRVDAEFRAYNDPTVSWDDHKRLLLTASRYAPYRAVMHNSILGAWALKRAGYATDSKYPLKLINLVKQYSLDNLDEVGI